MKRKILLAAMFVAIFAGSRIPGLFPANFSVVYAFAFCAGAFFAGAMAWWLPLVTLLVTDLALDIFYYHVSPFSLYMLGNYAVYAVLIALGKWIGGKAPLWKLLCGGIFGAVIFYLVSNTLSWLLDAAYAKTIAGWIQALTTGRPEWHPTTWEMFRNTLLSGGIFTALFAATGKATAESPAEKTAGARAPEAEGETDAEPEEAQA